MQQHPTDFIQMFLTCRRQAGTRSARQRGCARPGRTIRARPPYTSAALEGIRDTVRTRDFPSRSRRFIPMVGTPGGTPWRSLKGAPSSPFHILWHSHSCFFLALFASLDHTIRPLGRGGPVSLVPSVANSQFPQPGWSAHSPRPLANLLLLCTRLLTFLTSPLVCLVFQAMPAV